MEIGLFEEQAIPLLYIYAKDVPTNNNYTCPTLFLAALFIIARSYKQPRVPSTEQWIQKMWYIHILRAEYYAALKNNNFMKFSGKWTELVDIILSEVAWYVLTDKWILAKISLEYP